ncbi:unnamed protein product [Adineta steineri]|uniref:UNC93-like protein n=3 Tax=Adineta steineri TaxID=433720 RepID=A0A814Q630_9BILA|nr:unnamed protein product [Adineta steineri]CAF1472379.1 unnamed protein product [Adineta steineri]CAF4011842.1 unnamed protein product [Adineta steineri]
MSDDKKHMDTNNKNKKGGTKRNFIMICFAYTCATTSLNAVVNLQSSLNTDKDVGLNSVAITYGASLVTCLLFTTPLGYIFGYKWSIIGGQFGIMVYVASNMYPKQWLMYSTAIICGSLRACFSMAQNSYVTALANDESENDDDAEIKTRKYFGIFFTAFQSAQIWGNLISYLVLRNTPKTTNTNSTQCGANFLTDEHQMQDDNNLISQKTIYILYSTLSGIIFVSIVLTIILLVQRRDNKKEDDSQGLLRKSLDSILSTWKTALKLNHLLLIPLGFWTLSGEAFFMGAFTNSFITCTIGVQYVGLIMTIYGIIATIASIIVTYIVKLKYSRPICFLISSLLSYTIFIVMLVWKPTVSQTYVLFIIPCLSSIVDGLTEPFITGFT